MVFNSNRFAYWQNEFVFKNFKTRLKSTADSVAVQFLLAVKSLNSSAVSVHEQAMNNREPVCEQFSGFC